MINEEKKIWGIHSRDDFMFLKGSIIAIGWKEMGDLRLIEATRNAFKEKYIQTYPEAKKAVLRLLPACFFDFAAKYRLAIM